MKMKDKQRCEIEDLFGEYWSLGYREAQGEILADEANLVLHRLNCILSEINKENIDVIQLIRDLLHPEMYGHAVTPEIRDRARRVLGKAECETVK